MLPSDNRRILVIDDNEAIHADFRKIFENREASEAFATIECELFGAPAQTSPTASGHFEIESASQGEAGYEMTRRATADGNPYAVAFVDMRMPPGWDGIQTCLKLWSADPSLQVVLCTAHSDYSWQQTIDLLGASDRFLILKKPFDTAEVRQLALALSVKWSLARQASLRMDELERKVLVRTRELSAVNAQLRSEVSERERMELELVREEAMR